MNNKSKILVCSLSLLLILSIGYALFSEQIKISGSTTSNGDFKITTKSCVPGISDELKSLVVNEDIDFGIEGGYKDDFCRIENNDVKLGTTLLYPTANRNYTVKIVNEGSISADLTQIKNKNLKLCMDGLNNTPQNGLIESQECYDENAPGMDAEAIRNMYTMAGYYGLTEGHGLFITDENGKLMPLSQTYTLKPGGSLYLVINSNLSHYLEVNGDFLFTTSVDFEFLFEQTVR